MIAAVVSGACRVAGAVALCPSECCLQATVSCGSTQVHRDSILERTVVTNAHAIADDSAGSQRLSRLGVAAHDPTAERCVRGCAAEDAEGTE